MCSFSCLLGQLPELQGLRLPICSVRGADRGPGWGLRGSQCVVKLSDSMTDGSGIRLQPASDCDLGGAFDLPHPLFFPF